MIKIKCPCCGNYTFIVEKRELVLFDICDVCNWQYDEVAHDDPYRNVGGANTISLNEARKNYRQYGVSELRARDRVRKPFIEELPENNE